MRNDTSKLTRTIIAYDAGKPVYATQKHLAWRKELAALREQLEAATEHEQDEIKAKYYAVMLRD
jgi:hypothetical protein